MKRKPNFDLYLEEQVKDQGFAERFQKAGEAWDIALGPAALREESGLSQKELDKRVGTTQQQISRLESPSYEGHSPSMLRRVAEAHDQKCPAPVFEDNGFFTAIFHPNPEVRAQADARQGSSIPQVPRKSPRKSCGCSMYSKAICRGKNTNISLA